MKEKKTARRCCNTERANVREWRDAHIVAQDGEFDAATRRAGWIVGLSFGLMLMIGIMGGF